ncbi:MAG TPA: TetR/AcrR family transcriptional regulator [Acidimicrobiales bacterium]|nr:TetR/AcrR family transcriptional regulator [Acidimicrobiales bacterium]
MTDQEFGHQGPPEGCTRSSEAAAGRAPAPPRPALTRQRIVETALQLVERHGLDGLTMRRVAAALQVTPMSLYNHVADKAELVDLMVDYVIEDVVARSAQDEGDWEARIRGLCRRNYEVWKAHPGIVRIYAEGVSLGPNGLANLEHAVEILRQAGFSDDDAGSAVTLLYRWSMASLVVSRAQPTAADQPPLPQTATKEERMAAYFSALPREEIPNIEASAMTLSATSFDFGLDVIIAGLKARLAATTALQEPPDVQPGTSPGSPETAAEAAC